MGRPRKYPLPGDPPKPVAVATVERAPPDDETDDTEPLPEELVDLALDNPRMRLTPEMVLALNHEYKANVRADDEYGKTRARRCAERLKRATHPELHPGCTQVTLVVPQLKSHDGKGTWPVKINERVYVGKVEVWDCVARQILELVYQHKQVEAERMSDNRGATVDLDTNTLLSERATAIQRA